MYKLCEKCGAHYVASYKACPNCGSTDVKIVEKTD